MRSIWKIHSRTPQIVVPTKSGEVEVLLEELFHYELIDKDQPETSQNTSDPQPPPETFWEENIPFNIMADNNNDPFNHQNGRKPGNNQDDDYPNLRRAT